MVTINLLPKDLTPKESFVKLANTLKRASIIGFIALIVLALALLGGFAVLSRQLATSSDSQSSLKSKVVALETTEQRLVLVKDRLERIDQVLAIDTGSDEIEQLEKLTSLLPEGVTLQEVKLSAASSTITISAASSKTLSHFLAILLGSNIYTKVTLNSLSFNYLSGYSAILTLITAFEKTPDFQSGDELNAADEILSSAYMSSSFTGSPVFQSGEDVIN